ncbi:MAG: hypothetical protein RIQ60_1129 [Pseudomonadota bacterium]
MQILPAHKSPVHTGRATPPTRAAVYQATRLSHPELPAAPDAATLQQTIDASLRANAAYPNVILRSRHADDALQRARTRGLHQLVLLGAGFDSSALRLPSAKEQPLTIVEIDHPATQTLKRRCIDAAGRPWPITAHLVPADRAAEGLPTVLRRSPLHLAEPTFFSCLGVTMTQSRAANLATLHAIATAAAPGSELGFTYIDQARLDTPAAALSDAERSLHHDVASVGEPFVSGFHPADLPAELAAIGLQLLEDCSDVELLRRYDPEGVNGFVARGTSKVVHVRVGQRLE